MAEMDKIFKAAMDFKASDIHLSPGEPYIFRLFGKLRKVKVKCLRLRDVNSWFLSFYLMLKKSGLQKICSLILPWMLQDLGGSGAVQ